MSAAREADPLAGVRTSSTDSGEQGTVAVPPVGGDRSSGETPPVHQRSELLDVSDVARAVDNLTPLIGTGPLAGFLRRSGELVHVPALGEDGYDDRVIGSSPAQVRPVLGDRLRARVQHEYWCYAVVVTKESVKHVQTVVPRDAAGLLLADVDLLPNARELRGVVHTPVVRADGSVLDRPGYDDGTGLLYLPDRGLVVEPVPERPTREQLVAAVALVARMVVDFRYVTPHDRANYLGLLLTPLLREVCPPPYKLAVLGAHEKGSGKGLQATILRTLHGGVMRPPLPHEDEEVRKAITTTLWTTTAPVVVFDNAVGTLRSDQLAMLLTTDTWTDRLLGTNREVTVANDRLWLVTANNLGVGGDLARRVLRVTIDPGTPHPELRTGFAIPNLKGWVRDHRGEVLHALLVMVRAWVAAGRPVPPLASGDDYGQWVQVVGGILTHAGVDGTFGYVDPAERTGADDDEWSEFLRAAHRAFGHNAWQVRELLALVVELPDPSAAGRLDLDVLPAELTAKRRYGDPLARLARPLGKWLQNREGRWADGRAARRAGQTRERVALWRVECSRCADGEQS